VFVTMSVVVDLTRHQNLRAVLSDVCAEDKSTSLSMLRVGSWNVRSMASVRKRRLILKVLEKAPVDFIAVQETRIGGSHQFALPGFTLLNFGYMNDNEQCHNGVGLLIRKGFENLIKNVHEINESMGRIIVFTSNHFSIVCAYAPHEGHDDSEKEKFFDLLECTLKLWASNKLPLFLAGDFNAVIGEDSSNSIVGTNFMFPELTNSFNGDLLCEIASRRRLFFPSSFRRSSVFSKCTHLNVNSKLKRRARQIDHILLNKRFGHALHDYYSYGQFSEISDHKMIIAHLRLSRPLFKKPKSPRSITVWNTENLSVLAHAMKENLYSNCVHYENVNDHWGRLSVAIQRGIKVVPKTVVRDEGENTGLIEEKWWNNRAAQIEEHHVKGNMGEVFKLIHSSYIKRKPILADANHVLKCLSIPNIPESFDQFNLQTVMNKHECYTPSFLKFSRIVYSMKSGKADGIDSIPVDVYKNEFICKELYSLFLKIWFHRKIPDQWRHAIMVPVPKKQRGEYRGVSLLCSAYKVYSKLLLFEIIDTISKQCSNQYGFLPKRSTRDVIGILRHLEEKSIANKSNLFSILVDFSKAFDRINRDALRLILYNMNIDFRMVERIMDLLTCTTYSVRSGNSVSATILQERGVRQGCPISPLLFIVVLDFLLKSVDHKFEKSILFQLAYADDLTIVGVEQEQVENAFKFLSKEGEQLGLIVNSKKTERLTYNHGICVSVGVSLLGSFIGDWEKAVQLRINKARGAFMALQTKLWKTKISFPTKFKVFKVVIMPTLLYSLESLPLSKPRMKSLDSFVYRCFKSIFGLPFHSPVRNEELLCAVNAHISFAMPSDVLPKLMVDFFDKFEKDHKFIATWSPPKPLTRIKGGKSLSFTRVVQNFKKELGIDRKRKAPEQDLEGENVPKRRSRRILLLSSLPVNTRKRKMQSNETQEFLVPLKRRNRRVQFSQNFEFP
jgi:exonuclease III